MNFAGALDHFTIAQGPYTLFYEGDSEHKNTEILDRVQRMAGALERLGVKPGDRVAMVLPTSARHIVAMWGAMRAGAIAVPLDFSLAGEEIAAIRRDCRPAVIVTDARYLAKTRGGADDAPAAATPVVDATPGATGPLAMDTLLAEAPDRHAPAARSGDDVAAILYTSGSTGAPKGVMLSHENLLAKGAPGDYRRGVPPTPATVETTPIRMLLFLPISHSFGFIMLQMVCRTPLAAVLQERFQLEETVGLIERFRPALVPAVPTVFNYLLNAPEAAGRDLSSVLFWISGGAALPLSTYDRWLERFGRGILQGYGLTEASASVSANLDPSGGKRGSIGRPAPGVKVRVVGEHGQTLPPNEPGELLISGDGVMAGYYNKPELTRQVLKDGWLHTGDVARIDEEGYIFIVDRIKDLIIRGGMNVYPREVEEAVLKDPGVGEAAVIGVPDEMYGEEIVAFVTPRGDLRPTPDGVRAEAEQHVARYKTPREVIVLASLPRNELGKVMKKELKRRYLLGEFRGR
ncbi:MAG: AMP-binding protein [Planctomycetes bacterium]|nr:AMP-binding protein [Planctomycetota bacterium]